MQKRKIEWYGGRICAKTALADLVSSENCIDPGEIVISNASTGRPFAVLPSPTSCGVEKHDISISHSSGIACAAAATSFCGIDVQEPKETLLRVYDRFCLKHEEELLLSSLKDPGQIDCLTLLWAAKESIRKACSHAHLPEFLNISLQEVDSHGDSYRLLFSCRHQQFVVIGCFHLGYGLAFCLVKDYQLKE